MDDSEEMGTTVELFVYDLTNGMAAMMSKVLIGELLISLSLQLFYSEIFFIYKLKERLCKFFLLRLHHF